MSAQAEQARNLIRVGRQQEAVGVLLQSLTSTPDDYELHCLLAQAYLGLKQAPAALRAADAAARASPDDEWPHRLRSIALRRLGRARQAVDAAAQAVRLAPEEPYGRHALAEAHLEAKQHDQAYAQAVEAVRLAPYSADMHDLLGRCMIRKHMYKEAEASFRRALQLDPNDAAAHNNLGVVLDGTGRKVEAVTEFNEAARLDPSFETARRNLYSGTRFLVGGGSAVFLIYLVIRLAVIANLSRRSLGLGLVGAAILVAIIVIWVRRYRPFLRKPALPATALAYYKAENRRLRLANRPILLLRLASVPVLAGSGALAAALDQFAIFLAGLALAAGLFFLSPWAWRRLVQGPSGP
jgi:Flp pilus assembly protein TadD